MKLVLALCAMVLSCWYSYLWWEYFGFNEQIWFIRDHWMLAGAPLLLGLASSLGTSR